MADVGGIEPVVQLAGTVITVLGGIAVAYVARAGSRSAKAEGPEGAAKEISEAHADIIELMEEAGGIKKLLLDFWQWSRDREQTASEFRQWVKEHRS